VKPEKMVLTAFPRAATAFDYSYAATELEDALASLPGALAVYSYGTVNSLGISDVDRLAVIENSQKIPAVWSSLSELTRRLAMHTPVLVDERTFRYHRWFAEAGGLGHVWGERFAVEDRPIPEYSEPLLAAEALVIVALKLSKLRITGRVKVRPLLCELGNVGIDLRLAKIQPADAPRAWELAETVTRLRDEWWSLKRAEQAASVFDVLRIAPDAIGEVLCVFSVEFGHLQPPPPFRLGVGWRNVSVAAGERSDEEPSPLIAVFARWHRLGELRWRWRNRQIRFPPSVISLLAGAPPDEYKEFRTKRDELVRSHVAFLAPRPGYSPIGLATIFLPSGERHERSRFARTVQRPA
jgi:hypothetical protein